MPEKDKLISYVIGTGKEPFKSSCATGDFAAVMAIAGRVYQPINPAFGDKCLRAAQKAWAWIEKYPNVTFRNPPGVSTGEYGDGNCADERLWAAAELFRSTGDKAYASYFLDHYAAFRKPTVTEEAEPPSWANVGSLALWTYAMGKGGDPVAVNAIRHDLIGAADEIAKRQESNGYRISLTNRDYIWGLERGAGELRHGVADRRRAGEQYTLPRGGAGRSALPARPEHVFAVVRHPCGGKSLPPSASSAERRG